MTESYNCRQKCCVLQSSENKTCRREPQLEYRRHLSFASPCFDPRDTPGNWLSPWFRDFIFRTRQLPSLTGKKEIAKLCHSPWIALGSTGCPRGRPTRKQMISALRQRRWGSRENYVVDVLCERPRINQSKFWTPTVLWLDGSWHDVWDSTGTVFSFLKPGLNVQPVLKFSPGWNFYPCNRDLLKEAFFLQGGLVFQPG